MSKAPYFLLLVFYLMLPRSGNCSVSHVSSPDYSSSPCSGKFSAGDNSAWASPSIDDSNWRTVKVPGSEIKRKKAGQIVVLYSMDTASLMYGCNEAGADRCLAKDEFFDKLRDLRNG